MPKFGEILASRYFSTFPEKNSPNLLSLLYVNGISTTTDLLPQEKLNIIR